MISSSKLLTNLTISANNPLSNITHKLSNINNKPASSNFNLFKNNMNTLVNIRYKFSSSSANNANSSKQQYNRTYLVRIQYNNPSDIYYQSYAYRQQFRKQLNKLQNSNLCYIFGGDNYPFESTKLVINCDQKQVIQNFMNHNVYKSNKLIKDYSIQQVSKLSQQKMKKLSYFYQYL